MAELVVLNGARAGAVFELPDMPTVVGRSPEAHFQLDDPWISSMHAMFERRGAEIWVVDLESRNGTFVGSARVQEALLQAGTVLRFGRTEVRVELRPTRLRAPAPRRLTPPSIPVPRPNPTSRLNAPDVTGSTRIVSERDLPDALPLAPRAVALLRMTLHLRAGASAPDGEVVRAAGEALQRAALGEGGLVNPVGAGALLAVFEAADGSPDAADRALRAARAARREVADLGGGLALRAALDGGPVVLGDVGDDDARALTVLGEVAERSERILALAEPGEILVGPGAAGTLGLEPGAKRRVGGEEIEVARG